MLRKLKNGFYLVMAFFVLTSCSSGYDICYCDAIAQLVHFPTTELQIDERFADVAWRIDGTDAYLFEMTTTISNNSSYHISRICFLPRIEFLYKNEWYIAHPALHGLALSFNTQAPGTSKEIVIPLMSAHPLPRVDMFRLRMEMVMHQEAVLQSSYALPRHDMVIYFVNDFDFILCHCLENNLLFDIGMFEQSPPIAVCGSSVFMNFEWCLNDIELLKLIDTPSLNRSMEALALDTQISYNGTVTDNTAWRLRSPATFPLYLDFFYYGNWYQAPFHITSRGTKWLGFPFLRTSDFFNENQNTVRVERIVLTNFCHPLPPAELYRMRKRFELVTDSHIYYQYFVLEFNLADFLIP